MRIAIMQPTYLPWLGYFNLIAQADKFVFLDDVQFSRQSWQQRNRIIVGDEMVWISVPVVTSGRMGQTIREVEVSDTTPWRKKQLGSLSGALARAPYGQEVIELVKPTLESRESRLCEINIALITAIADYLELPTSLYRSSELACEGGRSERLLAICRTLGGSRYLSPAGARDYISEDGAFSDAAFPVSFQSFSPGPYRDAAPLRAGEFPSIIDAIAWTGRKNTRTLIDQEIK
ncbi:MAG: WbqC family protein [Tabrizicola sp.]|nr:WbqC family protein [Tabrizicola sp.]